MSVKKICDTKFSLVRSMINFKIFIVCSRPFVFGLKKKIVYNKILKEHACPRLNLEKYFTNFNETREYALSLVFIVKIIVTIY